MTTQLRNSNVKAGYLLDSLKANTENRVLAKVIDLALIVVATELLSWLWTPLLFVSIPLAWGLVDRMGRGQSPGKWLLGLHCMNPQTRTRIPFFASLIRNLPFVVLSLAVNTQGFWAWLWLIIGFTLTVFEFYFIVNLRSGIRLGDVIASTRVFDYKDEHTLFIEQFLKDDDALGGSL
jgi:uncharacterized RDD family membrane protein YckC